MKPSDEPQPFEREAIIVRPMTEADLEAVIDLDAAAVGRRRPEYLERMIERAKIRCAEQVSLVAEVDGKIAGFVAGTVLLGEFGFRERAATIDVIGVDVNLRRRHLGRRLMDELREELSRLGARTLRLEVELDQYELISFFRREKMILSSRLCLEQPIAGGASGE